MPISFDPEALRTRIDENRDNNGCAKCENHRQTIHDLKKILTKKLTLMTVLKKMANTLRIGLFSLVRDGVL